MPALQCRRPSAIAERPRGNRLIELERKTLKSFQELELISALQQALAEESYTTPTPIQAQTIPPALEGRDVLGCAQTGTGKTAAFALPILQRLGRRNRKAQPNHPFVLVLAPTRELAIQIRDSFAAYGRHLQLRTALIYGGVSQVNQIKAINRGAHIVVATPGRLLDLMKQGHIKLDQLEVFVLDEADRMLDMGFLPDIKRIIRHLPEQRQSLFFSATLPPQIVELIQQLLRNPFRVDVTPKQRSVTQIEQKVLHVHRDQKPSLLRDILNRGEVDRTLVFTRTKRGADVVTKQLSKGGIDAAAIHGNKSQNQRQRALDAFRRNQIQVLVATDVAARGIDIDGISHVINYDMPVEPESYVHRIGRTGRAGARGVALSFCTAGERGELKAIEKLIGHRVPVDANHQPALPSDSRDVARDDGQHRQQSHVRRPSRPERNSSRPQHSSSRQHAEQRRPSDGKPPQEQRPKQQFRGKKRRRRQFVEA
jgi:ATP-dependent RNA helicase RhlE